MLTIQTDNRFMNTVHNGFKKFLGRKNIVQRTGTIFSQALSHTVKAIGHLAEFLVSAHIQTFLIVMIGDFKDTTRQFLDRLVDGTGKPDQQHDTGKNTNSTCNGNPQQSTFQSGHGGRAVWFGGCQYLKIHYGESNQQNDHTGQNAYTEY